MVDIRYFVHGEPFARRECNRVVEVGEVIPLNGLEFKVEGVTHEKENVRIDVVETGNKATRMKSIVKSILMHGEAVILIYVFLSFPAFLLHFAP